MLAGIDQLLSFTVADLQAEFLTVFMKPSYQIRSVDTAGKTGVVLYFGSRHDLATHHHLLH